MLKTSDEEFKAIRKEMRALFPKTLLMPMPSKTTIIRSLQAYAKCSGVKANDLNKKAIIAAIIAADIHNSWTYRVGKNDWFIAAFRDVWTTMSDLGCVDKKIFKHYPRVLPKMLRKAGYSDARVNYDADI